MAPPALVRLFLKGDNPVKVVPLGDNVVVRRLESEETTAGGIVLPDTARERPQQGRVLSVGDGRLLSDGSRVGHQVSEGDRVLFGKYAGTEVEVDSEQLLIMSEDDILAIVP
jgi:chaperonin GroES